MSSPVFQKIIKNVKDAFWSPELDTQEEGICFVREETFLEFKDEVRGLVEEAREAIDAEIKELVDENRDILAKMQEMLDAHRGLEEKVESFSTIEEKISELSQAISGLKGDLEARLNEVEKELSQHGEKAKALETGLSDLERKVDDLTSTVNDNKGMDDVIKRLEALEGDRDRIQGDLKAFSVDWKEREGKLQALEAEIKGVLQKAEAFLEESAKYDSEFKKIHSSHKKLRDQVSEYSRFIEVVLLDKINERIAKILSDEMGVEVEGTLENHDVAVGDGKSIEFEIMGHAHKDGIKYLIAGAFVKQLKKKDLTDFLKKIDKVKAHHKDQLIPIVVANQVPAQVKKFASKQDVKLYLLNELF